LAVLSSYSDASGTVNSEHALVVSGFVSTAEKWMRFEKRWTQTLTLFDVPYFHMNEFAHSTGVYTAWKGNEKRREAFIKRLISCCIANVIHGFSCGIVLSDYLEVNLKYKYRERTGGPFAMCGRGYIADVQKWHKAGRYKDYPIDFVFDDGDYEKGKLLTHLQTYRYPLPIFKYGLPRKNDPSVVPVVPLQAADLVAWEHNKFMIARLTSESETVTMRRSLDQIRRKVPHKWQVITKKNMADACIHYNIPER
jgi:hypothetical protein